MASKAAWQSIDKVLESPAVTPEPIGIPPMPSHLTEFGFQFGPALVERCCSLPGERVMVTVKTPRAELDIYVTRTGLIRVFTKGKEWSRG